MSQESIENKLISKCRNNGRTVVQHGSKEKSNIEHILTVLMDYELLAVIRQKYTSLLHNLTRVTIKVIHKVNKKLLPNHQPTKTM